MTRLMIAKLGQPVLLRKADMIEDAGDPAIQELVDDMIETVFEAQGVGLAAPQVYRSLRIALAIDIASDPDKPALHVLINPEIEALGDEIAFGIEGCLSIDNLAGIVPRHRKIRVKALDRDGEPVEFIAEDHFARVIQHEYDHLQGVLYPMRVRDWQALAAASERRQLERMLEEGYDRR
jgi:peptide deformylase